MVQHRCNAPFDQNKRLMAKKMKRHQFNANLIYRNLLDLAKEHSADSLFALGREFYDRTECGICTNFVTKGDGFIHYENGSAISLMKIEKLPIPILGIKLSTIVEGSSAEFMIEPLLFPFTDEQLAAAWDYLEGLAEDEWKACHEQETT